MSVNIAGFIGFVNVVTILAVLLSLFILAEKAYRKEINAKEEDFIGGVIAHAVIIGLNAVSLGYLVLLYN